MTKQEQYYLYLNKVSGKAEYYTSRQELIQHTSIKEQADISMCIMVGILTELTENQYRVMTTDYAQETSE